MIVLTTGTRPDEVSGALDSIRRQSGIALESILVKNGPQPAGPAFDVELSLEQNVGVPGGRNHGARRARMPLLCFLDDDAAFIDEDSAVGHRIGGEPQVAS